MKLMSLRDSVAEVRTAILLFQMAGIVGLKQFPLDPTIKGFATRRFQSKKISEN